MDLTKDQKLFIDENFSQLPDLIELTRAAFMDDGLDGRTKEGRAVREYLAQKDLNYKTTKAEKVKDVNLSAEQKEFVEEYANDDMNAYRIAQIIFPDKNLSPLSKETLVIADHIKQVMPSNVAPEDSALNRAWEPCTSVPLLVKRINDWVGKKLKAGALNVQQQRSVDMVLMYLRSPRLSFTINNYTNQQDRDLFEAEFIRATWDKTDLTPDEINLYINVCVDYINLKNISNHMEKLNRLFNEADGQQEMSVRLAEILKTKSEEYNQCEKRQESLINRLNGDRAKRIANRNEQTTSILSLVELFQDEAERSLMIKIAEMQKRAVKKEVHRIEDMPSWKARVLGIGTDEVL
jgi:phage gpG-like protein|tara:strand:+ start:3382 stop:4431 length:1050 start_codon:yes stop_codon:yes gene_type:complete